MFSNKIKGFEEPKESRFNMDDKDAGDGRFYLGTDATIQDIENDEEEIGRYYDLLLEGKGDKKLIIQNLQDCQRRYRDFLSSLQRDLNRFAGKINGVSLPFIVNMILRQRLVTLDFFVLKKPNQDFIPKCWEIINDDKYCWTVKWQEKSYNENAIKKYGKKALNWRILSSLIFAIIDIMDLGEEVGKLLNDSLNPILDRLTGNNTPPINNDISITQSAIEATGTPTANEIPVAEIEFKDKPYWKNLAPVFDAYPQFEKDLPKLFTWVFIKESRDKNNPHLNWEKDQNSLAHYFKGINEKPKINWKVLEPLFGIGKFDSGSKSWKSLAHKKESDDFILLEQKLGRNLRKNNPQNQG